MDYITNSSGFSGFLQPSSPSLIHNFTGQNPLLPGILESTSPPSSIAFIDARVNEPMTLVAGLQADLSVLLDPDKDGVIQISDILGSHHGLTRIDIVSHGDSGSLLLGSAHVSSANLSTYSALLEGWQGNLAHDADILIYSCNVASDKSGQAFINELSELTGADVAASDDLTGSSTQGGDWILEYTTGAINEASPASTSSLERYSGILNVVYLSDLRPTANTNGWGPYEQDRSNGETSATDGRTLTLNGTTYAKGLGVHSFSSLTYELGGLYNRFQSDIGIDDEVGSLGSVVFRVLTDGVEIFRSGTLTGTSTTQLVDLDVTGRQTLQLIVDNADGSPYYDHANWADARLLSEPPPSVFLSDLDPIAAVNGWGPYERDRSNGETAAGDGGILTLNGITYSKGLGVHANSRLTYSLAGSYSRFQSDIGIDDSQGRLGAVVFVVEADGVEIFRSATFTGSTATESLNLDVTGVETLELIVENADSSINWDHANWADARLIADATEPPGEAAPPPVPAVPSISLALEPASVQEDGTPNLVYTFTRSGSTSSPLSVNYTVGGTATNGTDYTGISTAGTRKTVTFAAGSSTAAVTVDPIADATVEANETVALTLAAGSGYTIGTADPITGMIVNDDVNPIEGLVPGSFRDDFDGSTIDDEAWKVAWWREHGGQTGEERVYVRDGYLHLELVNDPDQGILSSAIETWQEFGYGRWEARLRPSDVPGVLNSFYTIDWDDYSTPNTPADGTKQEIDIEFLTRSFSGNTGEVHFAVHAEGRQSMNTNPDISLDFNPSEDFNVYGFDIRPDRIDWLVNGQVVNTYEYSVNDITIDSSYQLKLNTWTMTEWIGGPPQPGVTSVYMIDWISFTPYEDSEPADPPEGQPVLGPTPVPEPTPEAEPGSGAGLGSGSGSGSGSGGSLNLPLEPWWGGPAYYEQFSVAAQTEWVSQDFFPIAVFYGKPEHAAQLREAGINTYMRAENPQMFDSVDIMTREGMYLLLQNGWTPEQVGDDPYVVGWHVSEEVDMAPGSEEENLAWHRASAEQRRALNDGRFLQANFGNGVLGTYWAPNTMDDLIAEVDLTSVDKYAYTSPQVRYEYSRTPSWPSRQDPESAAAYGWQQDRMELLGSQLNGVPTGFQKPNWVFVETAMPFLFDYRNPGSMEPGAETIELEEIEGAVWNAIINGAAGIAYFQHNNDGINGTYSLVTGEPERIAKVTEINAQVQRMAPIINTQSYIWSFGSGLDTMLKVHEGYAYIFAMTTGGSGNRTFTLPPGISGTQVDVVDEGRTLTVTNGSFTDSFTAEHQHHIYRIPLSLAR